MRSPLRNQPSGRYHHPVGKSATCLTIWKVGWVITGILLAAWTIVVVGSFRGLAAGFPTLYLSQAASAVNPAYHQLIRWEDLPPNEALAKVSFGTSSATWLFDEMTSDGTYRGGRYNFILQLGGSTCGGRRPNCQASLQFGYCTGSCAVLPAAAINTRVEINSVPDTKDPTIDAPPLQLAGCPCHLYLTIGSVAPPGASWLLEDNAHIASHFNPPNPPDNGLGFIVSLTLLLAIGLPYVIISPFAWIAVWYLGRRQRQPLAT